MQYEKGRFDKGDNKRQTGGEEKVQVEEILPYLIDLGFGEPKKSEFLLSSWMPRSEAMMKSFT